MTHPHQGAEQGEEFFEQLVHEAEDMLFTLDGEGRYTFVNDSFVKHSGYTRNELYGSSPSIVLSDDDVEEGERRIEKLLSDEESESELWQTEMHPKQGNSIPIEIQFSLRYSESGGYDGLMGVARDQSQRRRKEQKLRVISRVLRHNFRNDLNNLQGRLRMIAEEAEDDQLRSDIEKVEQISTGLLDTSEKARRVQSEIRDRPTFYEVNIARRAYQLKDVHHSTPNVEVEFEGPETCVARVPEGFSDAIVELIENAIEHNERDGVTRVRVEVLKREESGEVEIRVIDECPRIPPQEIQALSLGTEPSLSHSSGIGLWMVNWIVEVGEGNLRFETWENGNRVVISFPLVRDPDP